MSGFPVPPSELIQSLDHGMTVMRKVRRAVEAELNMTIATEEDMNRLFVKVAAARIAVAKLTDALWGLEDRLEKAMFAEDA